ncbi:MAG: flagellin FliC, partial [Planctomycetes bacterium]|nr:flagellin FliC [Planctomycetota bacterium]
DLLVIQESRNITDGISLVQTASMYEAVASKSLVRMKELAAQAASGTYSDQQKGIMQQEFDQLAAENARAAASVEFNGVKLHQGGVIKIHAGEAQVIEVHTEAVKTVKADLVNDAEGAMTVVDTAIKRTSAYRGELGATAKRLRLAADVLSVKAENLMAAKSRISDADIAKSTAALAAANVRSEVVIAIYAQANSDASGVLALLRG